FHVHGRAPLGAQREHGGQLRRGLRGWSGVGKHEQRQEGSKHSVGRHGLCNGLDGRWAESGSNASILPAPGGAHNDGPAGGGRDSFGLCLRPKSHSQLPRASAMRSLPTVRAAVGTTFALLALLFPSAPAAAADEAKAEFLDLSLTVAAEYPCTWPTWPRFVLHHYERIGRLSPYNSDVLVKDGNTATQLDVPPHSATAPGSRLPNAGPFGLAFTDKIPAWQFGGEACVLDCTDLRDSAPNGRSDLVTKERVMAWERKHRPLRLGDV